MKWPAKTKELVDKYTTDESLAGHINFFETAFPNYEIVSEALIAEDNNVVAKARFKGKHSGYMGAIAPTYNQVDIPFVIIYKIENEKIISHWILADQMSLMQQLGVMPAAEAMD